MEDPAWIPWDSRRLTHWGMEAPAAAWPATEPAAAIWPAPAGVPVEYYHDQYAAAEILLGSCLQISSIPTTNSAFNRGPQLVEYAEAKHDALMIEEAAGEKEETDPIGKQEFDEAAREFKVDMDVMRMKIHRYPASLRAFDEWYTVPRLVAIGPYHYGARRAPVEKAKHAAAHHCIKESGRSPQEVYGAVVSAAHHARRLYDKDVMAGMDDGDFLSMMFYDACFLVQYMRWCTDSIVEVDASLCRFFEFNRKILRHDLMLLQNQLPWLVVETVMSFRPVDLSDFISDWRVYLQERKALEKKPVVVLDDGYQPPHLLGLLRFYMVGKRSNNATKLHTRPKIDSFSVSASAVELAEIGITVTAAKNTIELIHMGINKRGILSAELSLVPLTLDDERASFLLNMAAHELCTTPSFRDGEDEDSAVCSYILLLSMLVHREEDVQELRTRHLLQGGAGLINKDALDFLTKVQSLPLHGGSFYDRVMVEVEEYKVRRRLRTKVHAFLYKNKRTIIAAFSIIGVLVSILGTLKSLK